MRNEFNGLAFSPADILMPNKCDLTQWSVVACDQYTSQPEYWERVERTVGAAPSALHLILPESSLEGPSVEQDITEINMTMAKYLKEGRFREYRDALFYVERKLDNGATRKGIIGMVDLDQYDYEPGTGTLIRATEGTVLSRIPPRVAVRKNAPIELPHVMLLTDDPGQTVIEPLASAKEHLEQVYDFELMERGGHITSWLLGEREQLQVAEAIRALASPTSFTAKYGTEQPVLLFAVGDGNHSLATAKESYERQKQLAAPEHWASLPARYALVELTNLHDSSLIFEPIHRVVFGVSTEDLLTALLNFYPDAHKGAGEGHVLEYVCSKEAGQLTVPHPRHQLPVGTLQAFLDNYLETHKSRVDYVHGDSVAKELGAKPGNIAFLLPPMKKEQLFPTVIYDGVLPRKTFSMGEAHDKRFYLEARKIR